MNWRYEEVLRGTPQVVTQFVYQPGMMINGMFVPMPEVMVNEGDDEMNLRQAHEWLFARRENPDYVPAVRRIVRIVHTEPPMVITNNDLVVQPS